MSAGTAIDELIRRLGLLPGAIVGRGPCHPTSPDSTIKARLGEFYENFPSVRRDNGYVEFQEKYAGATVDDPRRGMYLDILGFSDASTDIMELEEPVVDPDGFVLFAECLYHGTIDDASDMYEHDLAFNVRSQGVYCKTSTINTRSHGYRSHTDNFAAWLRNLTDCDGWYPRPEMP